MAKSAVPESAPKRSTTASATSPITGAAQTRNACRIVRLSAKRRKAAVEAGAVGAADISARGMHIYFLVAIWGLWVFVAAGFWLGWQLLRQNGRILLRLDELEKRLDELEFGGPGEPPMDSPASTGVDQQSAADADGHLLARSGDHPLPVGRGEGRGEGQRKERFSSRSLARSKIKRDG